MASSFAYPKSPKSPLTRQWLAMIGDGGEPDPDSTYARRNIMAHQQQRASLALTKSSSNDNRSWLSFVTESPSEELEAQSQGFHRGLSLPAISAPTVSYFEAGAGGGEPSRKVRFDRSIKKKHETPPPPPILKTSSSYGGGGGGSGNTCINKNSTSLQRYNKRDSNQSPADALFDIIQESLSCRTPTPSIPSSSSFLQTWERQWERGISIMFGGGEDDHFEGNLQSYSEDSCSDWSGERRRNERGIDVVSSPHSLNSLASSHSWDDVFLSLTDGEDDEEDSAALIPPDMSTDNQSGGSGSKYKEMLRRSKMAKRVETPVSVPSVQQRLKQSAFAPFRSRKTPSPIPSTIQPLLLSSSPPPQSATQPHSTPYLSERNNMPLTSAPTMTVQQNDHYRKTITSSISKEEKRKQMEDRIRRLQSNLKHQIAEKRPMPEALTGDTPDVEDRSSKENGRPPSRGASSTARNSTGTTTTSLSSKDHPPSENNYQLKNSDHSVGGALWVAAPAVSGLSDDSRQRNAPLVLLDDIRTTRSCISSPGLFRRRRRTLPITKGEANRPPTTIVTTPQAEQNHQVSIVPHQSASLTKWVSDDDGDSRSRHAYIAYFTRGPQVRASKSMRLYEHATPSQFPTLEYEVVVRVKVSTVSETDGKIRRGEYWGEGTTAHPLNLPVVPGTAFYGTLVQLDHRNSAKSVGWKLGDNVISLVRVGANSRHLCIGYDRLVKVPETVHPASAVCLPEVYLTAFQALHVEQARSKRYRKNSLSSKSILILGGTTKVGRALIELAVAAGSGTVYATAKGDKHFSLVEEAGGIPLDKDPHHWYSLLVGKMDLVVCVDCEDMQMSELKYEHIQTLKKCGRMVLLNGPEYQGEKIVDLSRVDDHSRGTSRRLYHYNVFEAWESDMKQGKRDLEHLLELLADGLINPKIFERIPLSKVPRAQDIVQKKCLVGFIVCEPWLKSDSENQPHSTSKHRPRSTEHRI